MLRKFMLKHLLFSKEYIENNLWELYKSLAFILVLDFILA